MDYELTTVYQERNGVQNAWQHKPKSFQNIPGIHDLRKPG